MVRAPDRDRAVEPVRAVLVRRAAEDAVQDVHALQIRDVAVAARQQDDAVHPVRVEHAAGLAVDGADLEDGADVEFADQGRERAALVAELLKRRPRALAASAVAHQSDLREIQRAFRVEAERVRRRKIAPSAAPVRQQREMA